MNLIVVHDALSGEAIFVNVARFVYMGRATGVEGLAPPGHTELRLDGSTLRVSESTEQIVALLKVVENVGVYELPTD